MKKVIQGEKSEFIVSLGVKDSSGVVRSFSLVGNIEISMKWKHASGFIQKNRVGATIGVVVVGADADGKIKGTLLATDTAAMPKTGAGLLEIVVDKGSGVVTKFQISSAFQVVEDVE